MSKNCAECGKTLTPRNSFQFNGKKVCRDCLHKLELEKEQTINENQEIPKRFYLPSNKTKFTFPQICPCCLGSSEKSYKETCKSTYDVHIYSLDIPICNACYKHIRKYDRMKGLGCLSIFFLVWLSIALLAAGNLLFSMFFCISIVLLYLYKKQKDQWISNHPGHASINKFPVSIKSKLQVDGSEGVLFEFKNSVYAELFSTMNPGMFVNK